MDLVYRPVVLAVVAGFALKGWPVTVTGGEHVPEAGGAIIATNHIGYLDFMISGHAVRQVTRDKRLVRFAAKSEVFDHPVSGPLMRGMKHLSVDRVGGGDAFLAQAVARLREGELVGMFPEGTIGRSFWPLRGKPGTVIMAREAGVPIIPGAIWGSQRLWTKDGRRPLTRNVPLSVGFGPPMSIEPDDDAIAATTELMDRIRALVDVAAREYPDAPTAGDDWWQPAHLGGSAMTQEDALARARADAAERRAQRRAHHREQQDGGAGDGSG